MAYSEAPTWPKWEQQFHIYFAAAELEKKSKPTQTAILLNVAGPEAQEVYSTFAFPSPEAKNDVEVVLKQFKTHCQPHHNTVFERHRFWTRDQQDGESIDQWVTNLKTKATACEFGEQRDPLIRDKIVFGLKDDRVKERLLREPNLSMPKAIDICRAAEATKQQVQAMSKDPPATEVHTLQSKRRSTAAFQTETR